MRKFDQKNFNRFIEENNVYGFFKEAITLKSGRKSHFYANWRRVVEDVFLTEKLSNFVLAFVRDKGIKVDTFYGVPEGVTTLGLITQYKFARQSKKYSKGSHVLAMGRAKPKEHGVPKDKYFIGTPRGKTIVIEDVTTTGESLINTLDRLREENVDVRGAISLTNRMEKRDDGMSVQKAIKEKGYNFYSMSSALEILPAMYARLIPGNGIREAIESEFEEYGVNPIKLI